jgi:hypothetical protein
MARALARDMTGPELGRRGGASRPGAGNPRSYALCTCWQSRPPDESPFGLATPPFRVGIRTKRRIKAWIATR